MRLVVASPDFLHLLGPVHGSFLWRKTVGCMNRPHSDPPPHTVRPGRWNMTSCDVWTRGAVLTSGRRRSHTCLDVSRAVCFDFPSCSASLFLSLCLAATIQTRIKKFEVGAQTDTRRQYMSYHIPGLMKEQRAHAEHLPAHAFHLPRNWVTFSSERLFFPLRSAP